MFRSLLPLSTSLTPLPLSMPTEPVNYRRRWRHHRRGRRTQCQGQRPPCREKELRNHTGIVYGTKPVGQAEDRGASPGAANDDRGKQRSIARPGNSVPRQMNGPTGRLAPSPCLATEPSPRARTAGVDARALGLGLALFRCKPCVAELAAGEAQFHYFHDKWMCLVAVVGLERFGHVKAKWTVLAWCHRCREEGSGTGREGWGGDRGACKTDRGEPETLREDDDDRGRQVKPD